MHAFILSCMFMLLSSATALLGADAQQKFTLKSSDFTDLKSLPLSAVCLPKGENKSPSLSWENPPEGTKSYALVCMDPDAPGGNYIHWIVYNIPVGTDHLSSGLAKLESLEGSILQGTNTFRKIGYDGPCPSPGKPHKYLFTLYALDKMLEAKPGMTIKELDKSMENHKLRKALIIGIYGTEIN